MRKKVSYAAGVFFLGTIVAGLVGYVATKEAYRNKKIEQEIESLKQEAQNVRNENNILEEKIAYFQTPEFQEKVAKEKLNLQKPDEKVVVVKPVVEKKDVLQTENVSDGEYVETKNPNYRKWWDYFFSY